MSARPLDWDDLTRELDLWAEAGRVASLWWRDDDAVEPTPALARLVDLAGAQGLALGLAVIPVGAGEPLAGALAPHPHVTVLQHGYRHQSHAPPGRPAIECGGDRPVGTVIDEMRDGRRLLARLFGSRFAPVLAAPWNHFDPLVLAALAAAGWHGASALGPRAGWPATPGLALVNIHVDPIRWRGGARFAGLDKALRSLVGELQARRTGATDPDEPLGLLTHHLAHDAETWAYLERLLRLTNAHPAARWLGIDAVFGLGRPAAAVGAAS